MGIFGALTTAVAGLRAQSFALENISGNIANSQTTGFKRTETRFVDFVVDLPVSQQKSGSVSAFSRSTNTVQGDVQSAEVSTYMAINGDGFFVVDESVGNSDNTVDFSGSNLFTRRGDFELSKDGFLVNGSGYYLKGYQLNPETGSRINGLAAPLEFSNSLLPAQVTTAVRYEANLAKVPSSEPFNAADYTSTDFVTQAEEGTFLDQSIDGGAITMFTTTGDKVDVQYRWSQTDPANNEWQLYYLSNSSATGAANKWSAVQNSGTTVTYTFGSNGQLTSANNILQTGLTVNGSTIGDVTLQHGASGLSQFSDPNGNAQITRLTQNGFSAGELTSIDVGDGGVIRGTYSNGISIDIAEVAVATFNAPNGLKKTDGGAYLETQISGSALFTDGNNVIGGAVEASNADVAEEFTKLIVTQQAYSAGTRIVSTSDEMLQEALNMIR